MVVYEPPEEYEAARRLRGYDIERLRRMVADALAGEQGELEVSHLSVEQCVTILISEGIYR